LPGQAAEIAAKGATIEGFQDASMTLFLASIASPAEARIVIEAGADLIDCAGLPAEAVAAVVASVDRRRPVGALAADKAMSPVRLASRCEALSKAGVDAIGLSLFASPACYDAIGSLAALAERMRLIGIFYVDQAPDYDLLGALAESGFAGVLLDTASGRLLELQPIEALAAFSQRSRALGLDVGFAGALEAPDVPRLLRLRPDCLGFRSALCKVGQSGVDAAASARIRQMIPGDRNPDGDRPPAKVGHSAKLQPVGHILTTGASDRMFVHDFVLPVSIGAYRQERQRQQRVRFNVDVDVLRLSHSPEDMRDVFSYDLVTDGIRLLVAGEHVDLVETLAERIAALVLTHPRALRVGVRVEKLDIGAGGIGVEIWREAAPGRAEGLCPAVQADNEPNAAH
jgi:FolB domain-containing protein